MTVRLLLALAILLALAWLARRSPSLSDHHVHGFGWRAFAEDWLDPEMDVYDRCAICEWDAIERRVGG